MWACGTKSLSQNPGDAGRGHFMARLSHRLAQGDEMGTADNPLEPKQGYENAAYKSRYACLDNAAHLARQFNYLHAAARNSDLDALGTLPRPLRCLEQQLRSNPCRQLEP